MRRAFSLIEILVALGVLVILVLGFVSRIGEGAARKGELALVSSTVRHLAKGLQEYARDTGVLPSSLDELVSDPGVAGWRGPYVKLSPSGGLVMAGKVPVGYTRSWSGATLNCGNLSGVPAFVIGGKGQEAELYLKYFSDFCVGVSGSDLVVAVR